MSKSIRQNPSRITFVILFFLAFISQPVILWALFYFAIPASHEKPVLCLILWILTITILVFMLSFWITFIPKTSIESFKTLNGNYAIPPQFGYYPLAPLGTALLLLLGPFLAPAIAIATANVIIFHPGEFLPALEEMNAVTILQSLNEIFNIPETFAILIWLLLVPLLIPKIWRLLKRQIRGMGKPALSLTADGLYSSLSETAIPWTAVTGVEVTDFTAIRLLGDQRLDRLRPTMPDFTPKAFIEFIGERGLNISVAALPVSSADLASVVSHFAKLKDDEE